MQALAVTTELQGWNVTGYPSGQQQMQATDAAVENKKVLVSM